MANNYEIPQGLRVYAIGDVHGMLDKLRAIHDAISADLIDNPPEDVHIVYLGDYIDRGPDSKGVIDYLMERRDRGDGVRKSFLLGNHDAGLLRFLNRGEDGASWLDWGGVETMQSYGVELSSDVLLPAEREEAPDWLRPRVPDAHIAFMQELEIYAEIGDYVFCHAGVKPHVPMEEQDIVDLFFIREPFLTYHKDAAYKPLPKRVVHGHTISELPEVKPHRVGIDTGAYRPGGKLTCGVFEGKSVRFLQV